MALTRLFFFTLALLAAGAPAFAAPQEKSTPIDISAEESLEWYQDQGLYVARGKARAIDGDTVVEADLLTAKKRSAAEAGKEKSAANDIAYLTATGRVRITSPRQKVFGEKAVYDLDRKTVKITGEGLKYMTAEDTVTAKDSLEYFEDKGVAIAKGRAVADHKGDRIEGDVLTAYFVKNAANEMEMDHMTAQGNVIVVTKNGDVSRGEKGLYDAKKDIAYLTGRVRITHGETQLAGDKAEVNFATGQSRLLNEGGGRVRALLPSSSKQDKKAE